MEGKKYRGHVILMPYAVQGHINPMVQFAKRLASKGVKTTLATTVYTVNSISAANVNVEPISDGFDISGFAQIGNQEVYYESFTVNGSRTVTDLIQKYRPTESPVTCLVYDSFLPWGLDVARANAVHGAAFFTNNVTVCSVLARVRSGLIPFPIDPADSPFVIRGLPPVNFIDLPSFLTRHWKTHRPYLDVMLIQFDNSEKADALLINSFEGLESKEEDKGDSEIFPGQLIGPMIPSAYLDGRIKDDKGYGSSLWKPMDEECKQWLDSKQPKSVIFISFGSMVTVTESQTIEIAYALEATDMHFLWIIKSTEIVKLPNNYLESVKDKSLIVPWCNQLEVLAHESIGCFMTHCGWNSTVEGLSLGVPMVALPQWSDQFCDAKFIDEVWKVGLWAKESDDDVGLVKREEIIRCLKGVTEGDRSAEIKDNATRWGHMAMEAISEGGSSDRVIDEFIESFVGVCEK